MRPRRGVVAVFSISRVGAAIPTPPPPPPKKKTPTGLAHCLPRIPRPHLRQLHDALEHPLLRRCHPSGRPDIALFACEPWMKASTRRATSRFPLVSTQVGRAPTAEMELRSPPCRPSELESSTALLLDTILSDEHAWTCGTSSSKGPSAASGRASCSPAQPVPTSAVQFHRAVAASKSAPGPRQTGRWLPFTSAIDGPDAAAV